MTTLDIIIIVILCVFFVIGFTRGLIKQFGSLVGYFVALWIAGHYYAPVADYIKKGLSGWQPFIASPLSVILGFIGAYIIAYFLFHLLINLVDAMFRFLSIVPFLNMTNRLGGGAIGLTEGLLLLSAVAYVLLNFPLSQEFADKLRNAKLIPVLEQVALVVKPFLPTAYTQGASLLQFNPTQLQAIDPTKIDINKLDPAAIRAYMKQLNISEDDLPAEVQALLNVSEKPSVTDKKK